MKDAGVFVDDKPKNKTFIIISMGIKTITNQVEKGPGGPSWTHIKHDILNVKIIDIKWPVSQSLSM